MNDNLAPKTESRQIMAKKLTWNVQSDELGRNEKQNI